MKYNSTLIVLLAVAFIAIVIGVIQTRENSQLRADNAVMTRNYKLSQEVIVLDQKMITIKELEADSLKSLLADFSEQSVRYQQILKEVGILVMRQCPDMLKGAQHPPQLRRPQSLPAQPRKPKQIEM